MLQNDQTQNFAQGSTVTNVWPATGTCWHTHVCCRIDQCRVAPRVKVDKGLADQMLLRVHTCLSQNRWFQGCTQGSKVTKVWPTSCCCEHTRTLQNMSIQRCTQGSRSATARTHTVRAHVSCRTDQSKGAPTEQGLQGLADPLLL